MLHIFNTAGYQNWYFNVKNLYLGKIMSIYLLKNSRWQGLKVNSSCGKSPLHLSNQFSHLGSEFTQKPLFKVANVYIFLLSEQNFFFRTCLLNTDYVQWDHDKSQRSTGNGLCSQGSLVHKMKIRDTNSSNGRWTRYMLFEVGRHISTG